MSVSPLALLREWSSRTDGAALRGFLLIGSEPDLPEVERNVVPAAREMEASVAVLGAAAPGTEPAAVFRPERSLALIERSGPDPLPELVLLVGDEHVVAAFGGGAPGLDLDRRPWSVLRGGPEGVPWAFADLGSWLRERAATGPVPAPMAAHLNGFADRLEDLVLSCPLEDPTRVAHNIDGPLIDRLPEGPVDELCLYAPLRGADPEALRALVGRLSPVSVVLGAPDDWPVEDVEAALRSLEEIGIRAEPRRVPDGVPRHGGLVEWAVDGRRSALTIGSHPRSLVRPAEAGLVLGAIVAADPPRAPVSPVAEEGRESEVAAEVEASGWTLEVDSGIHHVRGNFTNPVPVAARIAELVAEGDAPVMVHAQGPKAWALLVWSRPTMLLASAPRGSAWRLYSVRPPATPSSRLGGEGLSQVGLVRTSAPLHRAPHRDIIAFLDTLGTDHITLLEKVGFLGKTL
ncbi:VOC family protein [Nocardiopsis alba]|uniref:Uncharacterized protein n=1 Tax=Nocardiopsis alba (strain ATCC BAA-2165 / BE74) TaxID=1205910 RepID=J7LFU1_NOCAA|nr:hypothetical protein [Nocardiopsis alba]AFR09432.1 hypothetical protein B005_4516 [Nocardiopsis alba ATCC BAA-2165]